MSIRLYHFIFVPLLTLMITSCGNPSRPQINNGQDQVNINQQVQQWLDRARYSLSPEREQHLLAAAELLDKYEQDDWALNILISIDDNRLQDTDYLTFCEIYSSKAIATGQYFKARDILTRVRLEDLWHTLTHEQRITFLQDRTHVNSLLGNYPQSFNDRILLGNLVADDAGASANNNEAIWQDLMILSSAELTSLQATVSSDELYGWYLLAALSKNNAADLSLQLKLLNSWQRNWPQHSANKHLPGDLQLLQQLIDEEPLKIALLLPQQGRLSTAAAAVRDGFLAAFYAENNARATITQYDTNEQSILDVYQTAVFDGAQLIVGPLAKENVDSLSEYPSLEVPVLALNYKETHKNIATEAPDLEPNTTADPSIFNTDFFSTFISNPNSGLFQPKLYQFGLATEDEARQIARQAYIEGHRRAMVIAPDHDWAQRSVDAFTEQWSLQHGDVVAFSTYQSEQNYSETIKNSLLINESEERYKKIRQLVSEKTEFEPRRRQDIDMIFLIANPAQARQIKPTLAFHYASNIPIYATNLIYTGKTDKKADRDLNGIRFNTLPWLFDTNSKEKLAVERSTDTSAVYTKLHALGVDAFHLYPRLPQLERLPQTRILGSTGTLSLDQTGRIVREQVWAQFNNGVAKLLPTIVTTSDNFLTPSGQEASNE